MLHYVDHPVFSFDLDIYIQRFSRRWGPLQRLGQGQLEGWPVDTDFCRVTHLRRALQAVFPGKDNSY